MREIKFRAWDKDLKEMLFIDNIFNMTEKFSERGKLGYFILQQFTGLKDKNGKEIYEGDIVETNGIDGKLRWVFKYIEEDCGVYGGFNPEPVNYNLSSIHNNIENCEVIGNIFENPDLIK